MYSPSLPFGLVHATAFCNQLFVLSPHHFLIRLASSICTPPTAPQRLLLLQAELDAIASVVSQIDNTFTQQLKDSASLMSVCCFCLLVCPFSDCNHAIRPETIFH